MKTGNLRRVHTIDMQLNMKDFLQLCTAIGKIFEEDDENGLYYNHVQFQSSTNGGFWSVNICAFDMNLFLEFLSDLHQEMPVVNTNVSTETEIEVEPETIPLDESLEGVHTITPELSDEDIQALADEAEEGYELEDPTDDTEEVLEPSDSSPMPKKKRLLKPASIQRVASGVTVEEFDDEA